MRNGFALALIVTLAFAAYSASFFVPFVYDDDHFIVTNPGVTFKAPISLHSPRALTLFTYRLNYLFGQESPTGYHAFNFVLHCLNGLLVFSIVECGGMWGKKVGKGGDYAALLAAGLFLLHPLQSEAVIYLSGRTELFSACFVLLAFWYYLRERPYVSFIFFVLAVLSKESAIVLPLAIIGYEAIYSRFPQWTVFAGLILSIPATVLGYRTLEHADRPWLSHLFLQSAQFGRYLAMFLVPLGQSIDHDAESLPLALGATILAILIVIIGAAWTVRRELPMVTLGVIWIAIFMLPRFMLNIPEFSAEHHGYLPMFGLSLLTASLFSKGESHVHTRTNCGQSLESSSGIA